MLAKSFFKLIFKLVVISSFIILQSCATIVGGSKYYANVTVDDHNDAEIYYNGRIQGKGYASFLVPRKDADKLVFKITKQGCEDQSFYYTQRKLRGWAIFGTIITWTGSVVPIPYGLLVDFAFGSVWKPDNNERGIIKNDLKRYNYNLDYTGCVNNDNITPIAPVITKTKEERLLQLKKWFDESLITAEEYEVEKKRILTE